ncbi:MAG: hypothetical protein HYX68_21465 [Planctomycetes bacterium]|nr:hypothetical protein [Planctomycetota bacterium]
MNAKDPITNSSGAIMDSPGNLRIERLTREEALHYGLFVSRLPGIKLDGCLVRSGIE